VALGAAHSCALDEEGGVWCWGVGGAAEPEAVEGLPPIGSLTAGQGHSCAVGLDGTAWCWGAGERGQLGTGALASSAIPERVSGIANATAIAAGDLHTCVLHDGGSVSCWGDNSTGQLGGSVMQDPQPVPLHVLDGASHLSAGGIEGVSRTCAIRSGGAVWCWGRLEPEPAAVGIVEAKHLDVGVDHFCVVLDNGRLSCIEAFQDAALAKLEGMSWTRVSAGGLHSCALNEAGAVWCFGDDLDGQLGDGDGNATDDAVRAIGAGAIAIGTGALHSCAVLDGGHVRCWGENNNGRLGTGETGGMHSAPAEVVGFGD
jgi:alpha-tubulin suppressor-like RCC1 family protein